MIDYFPEISFVLLFIRKKLCKRIDYFIVVTQLCLIIHRYNKTRIGKVEKNNNSKQLNHCNMLVIDPWENNKSVGEAIKEQKTVNKKLAVKL